MFFILPTFPRLHWVPAENTQIWNSATFYDCCSTLYDCYSKSYAIKAATNISPLLDQIFPSELVWGVLYPLMGVKSEQLTMK